MRSSSRSIPACRLHSLKPSSLTSPSCVQYSPLRVRSNSHQYCPSPSWCGSWCGMCPSNMRSTSSVGRAWYLPGKRSGHEILTARRSSLAASQISSCFLLRIYCNKKVLRWMDHRTLCALWHIPFLQTGVWCNCYVGKKSVRKGAGQLPALLLDQDQLPSTHYLLAIRRQALPSKRLTLLRLGRGVAAFRMVS